jgi:hypothetical protein
MLLALGGKNHNLSRQHAELKDSTKLIHLPVRHKWMAFHYLPHFVLQRQEACGCIEDDESQNSLDKRHS